MVVMMMVVMVMLVGLVVLKISVIMGVLLIMVTSFISVIMGVLLIMVTSLPFKVSHHTAQCGGWATGFLLTAGEGLSLFLRGLSGRSDAD